MKPTRLPPRQQSYPSKPFCLLLIVLDRYLLVVVAVEREDAVLCLVPFPFSIANFSFCIFDVHPVHSYLLSKELQQWFRNLDKFK